MGKNKASERAKGSPKKKPKAKPSEGTSFTYIFHDPINRALTIHDDCVTEYYIDPPGFYRLPTVLPTEAAINEIGDVESWYKRHDSLHLEVAADEFGIDVGHAHRLYDSVSPESIHDLVTFRLYHDFSTNVFPPIISGNVSQSYRHYYSLRMNGELPDGYAYRDSNIPGYTEKNLPSMAKHNHSSRAPLIDSNTAMVAGTAIAAVMCLSFLFFNRRKNTYSRNSTAEQERIAPNSSPR